MKLLAGSDPRYFRALATIIILLVGIYIVGIVAQFYATGPKCQAWGWTEGRNGICYGELNSGDKISKPLKEIEAQTCVGPYQITRPTSKNKHPNNCPSGIHFTGKYPFFQHLKLTEDGATY